jgi:hypothetical protein
MDSRVEEPLAAALGVLAVAGILRNVGDHARVEEVAYLAPADNVLRPLSTCSDGTNRSVINPRIQFFGASCHPVD